MLMKLASAEDRGIFAENDLSNLRFHGQRRRAAEPRGRDLGREVLGLPFHDNWWQTETGGIMIANYRSEPIKPGSMGKPPARHRGRSSR
jgi:acetyl-CoA synthetase